MGSEKQGHWSWVTGLCGTKLKLCPSSPPVFAQSTAPPVTPDPKKHLGAVVKIRLSLEIPVAQFGAGPRSGHQASLVTRQKPQGRASPVPPRDPQASYTWYAAPFATMSLCSSPGWPRVSCFAATQTFLLPSGRPHCRAFHTSCKPHLPANNLLHTLFLLPDVICSLPPFGKKRTPPVEL